MAGRGDEFAITASQGMRDLSKKLKEASNGKELRTQLRQNITTATKPLVEDLRTSVMSIESKAQGTGGGAAARLGATVIRGREGDTEEQAVLRLGKSVERLHKKYTAGHFGLRATIARAITTKVRNSATKPGVKITVNLSRLPAAIRTLPRALDSLKGWRHPVFGHKVWVRQTGQPWWSKPVESRKDEVRAGVVAAVRSISDKLK